MNMVPRSSSNVDGNMDEESSIYNNSDRSIVPQEIEATEPDQLIIQYENTNHVASFVCHCPNHSLITHFQLPGLYCITLDISHTDAMVQNCAEIVLEAHGVIQ